MDVGLLPALTAIGRREASVCEHDSRLSQEAPLQTRLCAHYSPPHEYVGAMEAPGIVRLLSLHSSGTATADTGIASALTGALGGID